MPLPLLPQQTLDFTELSREDMLLRMQQLAHQVNPSWTDFSTAYPENIILELMAMYGDILRGVTEERARQSNWATMSDRLAAIRQGRLANYTLAGGSAATVVLTVATSNGAPAAVAIPIPTGFMVKAGSVRYQYLGAPTQIGVGISSIQITAEQSETEPFSFESPEEPNIELILDQTPYLDGSVTITCGDGAYTPSTTGTLSNYSDTDRVFLVIVDDQQRARVRFGNGISGAIPTGTISGSYRVGGGIQGEVEAGVTWNVETSLTDSGGNPATVRVSNAAASSAAADPTSTQEARILGPLALRTITKHAVNEDLHESEALLVPGIARAFMGTSENTESIAEDEGVLYLIGYGSQSASGSYAPATPTAATLATVAAKFAKGGPSPTIMGITLTVQAAQFYTVNITVKVHKQQGYAAETVSTNIRNAIADVFAVADSDKLPNPKVDFGFRMKNADGDPDYLFPWSTVFDAIRDAEGVRRIPPTTDNLLLNGARGDIQLQPNEFPIVGTVTILDADNSNTQI